MALAFLSLCPKGVVDEMIHAETNAEDQPFLWGLNSPLNILITLPLLRPDEISVSLATAAGDAPTWGKATDST